MKKLKFLSFNKRELQINEIGCVGLTVFGTLRKLLDIQSLKVYSI